jgi:hypothetical protein
VSAIQIRTITVELDPSAAERFDAAASAPGEEDNLLLAVEKAIVRLLYPERVVPAGLAAESVELDPDLVNVTGASA